MKVSKDKENILKNIRDALAAPTPVPFIQSEGNSNLFIPPHDDLSVIFAEEFSTLDGKFIYVENHSECLVVVTELLKRLKFEKVYCVEKSVQDIFNTNGNAIQFYNDLTTCDVSITTCEALVARTGTIVLTSTVTEGRTASVYCPVHICIAYTNQMFYDTRDALIALKEKYKNKLPSMITFATGPSRTADIEKTLVKGIHGPKEVFCILIEHK